MANKKKIVKDWAWVCKVNKEDPQILPIVSHLAQEDQDYLISEYRLIKAVKAYNTDENGKIWEPDYTNSAERKYEPILWIEADKKRPGGFGLSVTRYGRWRTGTNVGSRLVFKSTELLYECFENFKQDYIQAKLIIRK